MTWKPPQYGIRGRETQWIGSIIQTHDCFCGCEDPLKHLITAASRRGGLYSIDEKKAKTILKCLSTTTEDGATQTSGEEDVGGPEGDLDFGDLEKLFEEDGPLTENDAG